MLYPQNGDRIVAIDTVTSLHPTLHVLRTNRALTVLVSLQPISTKYSRDADARDRRTRRVTGSTCCESVQISSCAVNKL